MQDFSSKLQADVACAKLFNPYHVTTASLRCPPGSIAIGYHPDGSYVCCNNGTGTSANYWQQINNTIKTVTNSGIVTQPLNTVNTVVNNVANVANNAVNNVANTSSNAPAPVYQRPPATQNAGLSPAAQWAIVFVFIVILALMGWFILGKTGVISGGVDDIFGGSCASELALIQGL